MTKRSVDTSSIPVLLASAGMELCRWYITAGLLFIIPGRGTVPLLQSAFALIAAMLLALLLQSLKRRRITELLVHTTGLAVSLYLILKAYSGLPFSASEGLAGFIAAYGQIAAPGEWFAFFLIIAWTLLLWLRGRHLGNREADYSRTVSRFDAGMMLIFAVYFLRMGIRLEDPDALSSVGAYLIFGLLSIYTARNRDRDRNFIHSSSTSGLVLLFAAGTILAGGAGVLLYPVLADTAGELYTVIRKGTKPFQPLIIAFLRFLFGRRSAVTTEASSAGPSSGDLSPGPPQEPGFWTQLFEKIMVYSFAGILGILILLITGYLLWRLVSYLSSKSENEQEGLSFRDFLHILIRRGKAAVLSLVRWIRGIQQHLRYPGTRKTGAASTAFRRLSAWGRLAGIRRYPDETAGEYGRRLAASFPAVSESVQAIVKFAETELYGERKLSAPELRELRRARGRTGRFRLLPLRLVQRLGWRN